MLIIRTPQWSQDGLTLSTLDTAFVTDRIYRPVCEGLTFRLVEETASPPLRKRYDFDPTSLEERQNWDFAAIAEEDGQLAGFVAAQHVAWNRRVILWHLYVMPECRGRGVGRQLLGAANVYAQSVQARCLWLETQNINYPAIQFYRHSGFTFCGFDTTLYDPETLPQEEVAVYFARGV